LKTVIYLIDPAKRKVTRLTIPKDQNPLSIVDGLVRGDAVSLADFAGDRIFADLQRDMSVANLPFWVKNGGLVFGNAVIVGIDRKTPKNSIWRIKRSIKFYKCEEVVKEFGDHLNRFRWDGFSKNGRINPPLIPFWRRVLGLLGRALS